MVLKRKRGCFLHLISWERVTDELRSPKFKEKRGLWIEREARAALDLLSSGLLKDFQVITLSGVVYPFFAVVG